MDIENGSTRAARTNVATLRALLAVALLTAGLTFVATGTVSASDGQILCRGSNIFSNVYVSGGKATVSICKPPKDCPTYVSNCHIYYRWLTKCEWVWCTTFDDRSGWVLGDSATMFQWCQNGKQQYKLQYKTTWLAPTTKTMKAYGESESVIEIGGEAIYRLIARGWFNATNSVGYTFGTLMKIITATTGASDPAVVGTSGSSWITLSC
jgi:hypothetical protein